MTTPPDFDSLREQMVREQLEARGIVDERVLAAMRAVPRHRFVPEGVRHLAYQDGPLLIGENQTISQPYIVAYMSECLNLRGDETVLEVGTGSGYQTAILCHLCRYVVSVERYDTLARRAGVILAALALNNAEINVADGSEGMPDLAPFDAILVSALAPGVPEPLAQQLTDGGRMLIPIAEDRQARRQYLVRVNRRGDTWSVEHLIAVMFVPLLGRYGYKPRAAEGE
jgi:protein-L-isoaspartate(D-aspartate) O-methyltransferase